MNVISRIRSDLGITQRELGEALGVTQGNVHFYERGQTVPPKVARRLIAFAAGRGIRLSFDDIYAAPDEGDAEDAAGSEKSPPTALARYLRAKPAGESVRLANHLNVTPGFVSQIATGRRPCPVRLARAIWTLTGGAVPLAELCPDWQSIWPELAEKVAA